MQRNIFYALMALTFILVSGCRKGLDKALSASSSSFGSAPPSFALANASGRNIAYDNGSGLNCILSYDIVTNAVSLTQISGGNLTPLFSSSQGLPLDDGTFFAVNQYSNMITDNYNEVGGMHLLAYDLMGNGHQSYLIAYAPGTGQWWCFGPGSIANTWHFISSNNSGIGGYDLKSVYDKIITFEINGNGPRTALICYRPGAGIIYVLQNQPTSQTNPLFVNVFKSSTGIGGTNGFDLSNTMDQIIAVDDQPSTGNQDLMCYRPGGTGYFVYITHQSNSTAYNVAYWTHYGFPNFTFSNPQDRIIPYDINKDGTQDYMFCYSPGNVGSINIYTITGGVPYGGLVTSGINTTYPMNRDPYVEPNPTYDGDKFISFSGGEPGLSALLGYQNGGNLAYIFDLGTEYETFNLVYQYN